MEYKGQPKKVSEKLRWLIFSGSNDVIRRKCRLYSKYLVKIQKSRDYKL